MRDRRDGGPRCGPSDAEPVRPEPVGEGGGRAPRAAQRLCRREPLDLSTRQGAYYGDGDAAGETECRQERALPGVFRVGFPDGPIRGCHVACSSRPSVPPSLYARYVQTRARGGTGRPPGRSLRVTDPRRSAVGAGPVDEHHPCAGHHAIKSRCHLLLSWAHERSGLGSLRVFIVWHPSHGLSYGLLTSRTARPAEPLRWVPATAARGTRYPCASAAERKDSCRTSPSLRGDAGRCAAAVGTGT